MFEKPQYLTPDGYRRSAKNPLKKNSVKKAIAKKKLLSAKKLTKNVQRGISPEAAKLIAQAIKGMLNQ
jgi:hypothetical protein